MDAGAVKPCSGRTNGLPGRRSSSFDEGVPWREPRGVLARHVSRHPPWMGRQPETFGPVGACLHPSKPDRASKARPAGKCSKASRHEPGHGEEAARSGDVHRLPTLIANTITAMLAGQRCHRAQRARARVDRKDDHVSSGIRNGSPGARGTRRLLKSKRGILLAPGVSTKEEALNARHGAVHRFVSSRRVAAR